MRLRRGWTWALAFGVSAASPAAAQDAADPNREAREQARAAANQGWQHYQRGDYKKAIEFFREADRHFHALTVLLQLARAHDKLGQLLEARVVYQQIVDEQLANYAPVEFFQAQKDAAAAIEALAARIPTLEVVLVTDLARRDVEITVDGVPLPATADKPMPRNPGVYAIAARAPGRASVVREVRLEEGVARRVVLELPPPPSPATAPAPVPAPALAEPARQPDVAAGERGSLVPAFIGFGVGAAGLGVGAITGAMAMSKVSALDERCPDRICEQSDKDEHAAAGTLATVSTIGFIAGGAGVVAGAALLLLRPGGRGGEHEQAGLVVGPAWVGWKGAF